MKNLLINKSVMKKEIKNYKDYIKAIKKTFRPHICESIELEVFSKEKNVMVFSCGIGDDDKVLLKFGYDNTEILNLQEAKEDYKPLLKKQIEEYNPDDYSVSEDTDAEFENIQSIMKRMVEAIENDDEEEIAKIKQILNSKSKADFEKDFNPDEISNLITNKLHFVKEFQKIEYFQYNFKGLNEQLDEIIAASKDESVIDYIKDGFYFLGVTGLRTPKEKLIFSNLTEDFFFIEGDKCGQFSFKKKDQEFIDKGFYDLMEQYKTEKKVKEF